MKVLRYADNIDLLVELEKEFENMLYCLVTVLVFLYELTNNKNQTKVKCNRTKCTAEPI